MQLTKPESLGFSSERLVRIGPALQGFVDRNEAAGFVTLVARHGRIAYFESTGLANVAAGRPMAPDTLFRIYSMSKPITAAATLMLYEEGGFLLDDPIASFIPEFADTRVFVAEKPDGQIETAPLARPITIRHLLTHTSGITYPNENGNAVERAYVKGEVVGPGTTLANMMPRLAAAPLCHQPGAGWTYGFSIDVLGRLIEVVSGMPFDAFLRERMFEPLGMTDAGFFVPSAKYDRLAAVYGSDGKGNLVHHELDWFAYDKPPTFLSGGGGLVMTTSDYARFAQMLLNKGELDGARLLGRKTVELMSACQTPREQIPVVPPEWSLREGYGMALGVRTCVDLAQSGMLGSVGSYTWAGMMCTDFWIDPAEDLFAIVMLQGYERGTGRPGLDLRVLTYQALID